MGKVTRIRVGSSGHVTVVIGVGPGPQGRPRPERRRQQRVGERDRAVQAGTGKNKIRSKGGSVDSALPLVKAVSGKMPRNRLRELADDPDAAYISPDRPLHSYLNNAAVAVNAPVAWSQGLDGSGIGVAVLDSGTQNVNDLVSSGGNSIVYKNSFIAGNTSTADGWGHGTHVSGIISGNGHSSQGLYQGIAPNANLINLRVLDASGQASGQYRNRGHSKRHTTAEYLQHSGDQSFARASVYRVPVAKIRCARRWRRPGRPASWWWWRPATWPRQLRRTNGYGTITAPGNDPYRDHGGRHEDHGNSPTRTDDLIASYSSKGPTTIDHM